MSALVPVDRHERRRLLSASRWLPKSKPTAEECFDPANPTARTPLLFGTDESSSMSGSPIAEVSHGIAEIVRQFSMNTIVRRTMEMALVGFGQRVVVRHPFAPPDQFRPPRLEARGGTPLAEAGLLSAQMVEERLELYRRAEIDLKVRPHVFFLTDGQPTSPWDVIEQFARKVAEHESEKIAAYHALYTEGADASALAQIFVRPPRGLAGFLAGIRAISQSVTYASQHVVTPDFDLAENLPRPFETPGDDRPWPW
jgi:uncharacterized protein YegL